MEKNVINIYRNLIMSVNDTTVYAYQSETYGTTTI